MHLFSSALCSQRSYLLGEIFACQNTQIAFKVSFRFAVKLKTNLANRNVEQTTHDGAMTTGCEFLHNRIIWATRLQCIHILGEICDERFYWCSCCCCCHFWKIYVFITVKLYRNTNFKLHNNTNRVIFVDAVCLGMGFFCQRTGSTSATKKHRPFGVGATVFVIVSIQDSATILRSSCTFLTAYNIYQVRPSITNELAAQFQWYKCRTWVIISR